MKSQRITKVIRIHPVGTMKVSDVLFWTKLID